jgi:hemerythrin-like domain-containing protein
MVAVQATLLVEQVVYFAKYVDLRMLIRTKSQLMQYNLLLEKNLRASPRRDQMGENQTTTRRQPVLYTPIHKGIRNNLFKLSTNAGKMNFSNEASLDSLHNELDSLFAYVRLHHSLEDKFIHPLLSERVPGGAEKLEEEHRKVEHLMENLTAHFNNIRSKSEDFPKGRELGIEFYLSFIRFVTFFLAHLDEEEEHIQRALWDLCMAEELGATVGKMIASQTPEQSMQTLEMILSSASLDEIYDIYLMAKGGMPPQAFQSAVKFAQNILYADDWIVLKSRLGAE